MDTTHQALARAQWQTILFAERPSRVELLKLKSAWPLSTLTIRVHRNHAFEHVAAVTEPWFAWWGKSVSFVYSDYDDSLSFAFEDGAKVQLELLWLDLSRYSGRFESAALVEWLKGRLTALRAHTSAPIILVPTDATDDQQAALQKAGRDLPGVRVGDPRPVMEKLGARFFDERAAKFSGTRLSESASVLLARELACRWIPATVTQRIKAIAIDLDVDVETDPF